MLLLKLAWICLWIKGIGGVRYLQKAIMGLDKEQYHLVKEALHERANLLKIAPHLSGPLPIMLPVYT